MSDDKKENKYPLRAYWVTIIYVLLIVISAIFNNWFEFQKPLNLNEFGDFMAGTMSPLAIFWLVMVYMQKRKEMREQVEQTKVIADETKKQVAVMDKQFKKQYEPFFSCVEVKSGGTIDGSGGIYMEGIILAENFSSVALHLNGELLGVSDDESLFSIDVLGEGRNPIRGTPDRIEKGEIARIKFYIPINNKNDFENYHQFKISYGDLLGRYIELEGEFKFPNRDSGTIASVKGYKMQKGIEIEDVFSEESIIIDKKSKNPA